MRWLEAQSRFLTSTGFLAKFWINTPIQTEEPLLMDFHGIEALLGLPEFCVINQVIRPDRLDVHLARRDPSIVCPRCHHRPWETSETFRAHTKWTERLYHQVRAEFLGGCPGKKLARRYGLSARTVFRWSVERSRGGRPRNLGRAIGIDEYSRRKGHRYNTLIVDLDKGQPIVTFKGR